MRHATWGRVELSISSPVREKEEASSSSEPSGESGDSELPWLSPRSPHPISQVLNSSTTCCLTGVAELPWLRLKEWEVVRHVWGEACEEKTQWTLGGQDHCSCKEMLSLVSGEGGSVYLMTSQKPLRETYVSSQAFLRVWRGTKVTYFLLRH